MHFYQLIYVHLVVHLSQMFLCEVLDPTPANTKNFSLDISCYLLFLKQCASLFKSFCFPICFWMVVSWLSVLLLTASWASDEPACSPFYKNNWLQSELSVDSVGELYIGEKVKFGVTSCILSQQVFILKPNMHLPPSTQDVNDITFSTFIKSPLCEVHIPWTLNFEMNTCSNTRVIYAFWATGLPHECHEFSSLSVGPRQTEGEKKVYLKLGYLCRIESFQWWKFLQVIGCEALQRNRPPHLRTLFLQYAVV